MDTTIMSIINTVQTKPITTPVVTAPTDFKRTLTERVTEVNRITRTTALKKYDFGTTTSYEAQTKSKEELDAEIASSELPSSALAGDELIYSSFLKQLLLTKAIDSPQKWVDQNKVRKAYNLD